MTSVLTTHDRTVLEKIKDPEAGSSAPLLIDPDLPRDPHINDSAVYLAITQEERNIITAIQSVELQLAGMKPASSEPPLAQYVACVRSLDELVEEYPKYASARNNRAQALRRIYGDGILVKTPSKTSEAMPVLDSEASEAELISISSKILNDLTTAIALLTPLTPFSALSPQAAKTLSQAYTQRGAIYHLTAKQLSSKNAELRIADGRREGKWKSVEFEENASRDFMLGGRYGNEIAKALAVSTNPTAKLCGEMVKEAMRKEYAGETV
jgi:hypothetical protein